MASNVKIPNLNATSPTFVTPALGAATGTTLVLSGSATIYSNANIGVHNGLILGGTAKAVAGSGGANSIGIYSNDVANQLQGHVTLITDATAGNRRLAISAIEQGVAYRNINLAEGGGNVGVNTTIPSSKLTITSAINDGIKVTDGTVTGIMFLSSILTNSLAIGTVSNHPVAFYSNNAHRMTLDASGNLLVGATSTSAKIHIAYSDTSIDRVFGQSSNTTLQLQNTSATNNNFSCIANRDSGGTLNSQICFVNDNHTSQGHLEFIVRNGATLTTGMVLDKDGKVGIGVTPSANSKLQIKAASNINFNFRTGPVNSGFMSMNAINDTEGANIGMELRATEFAFTGPTTSVSISTAGSVGIATSTMNKKLNIYSVSPDTHLYISDVGPSITMANHQTAGSSTMQSLLVLSTTNGHYGLNAGATMLANNGNSRGDIYINSNYAGTGITNVIIQPTNGSVGIGKSPGQQLDLSTDNARKLSTTTWLTGSDSRLKENIFLADLDICYNIVKNLPLKRFSWKTQGIYANVEDRNATGWIAQDVQVVFPNAVKAQDEIIVPEVKDIDGNIITPEEIVVGCLSLQSDQIYKTMYGALQKTMSIVEELSAKNNALEARLLAAGI
jgi:hypothetical protein